LILPATAIAKWGFDGMVVGIIVAMILLSPALFWLPASGTKGSHEETLPDASESIEKTHVLGIWLTLLGTLVFFTGASALWSFTERIGTVVGFDAASIGILLSVTLVFATSGSLLAAAMADRFGNLKPFLAGGGGFLLALVFLNSAQNFHYYAIGACILTFVIGLALPYAVAEIAELDKDGRFIVLSVPAIGTGAMFGPGIAGVLAEGTDFVPLLIFGAIAIVLSSSLFIIAHLAALVKTKERAGEQPNHAH
ncbi:MAG: MFS transporter, partial [Pseudomonadales bacterium]